MEEKKERRNRNTKIAGNGEGSLYWSEALQRYIYQYIDKSGKRQSLRQKKGETNREFNKRVTDIKSKRDKGILTDNDPDKFITILKNYIEQKHKDNLTSKSSYERDLYTIKEIEIACRNFINKPIQKITSEDIEASKDDIRQYSNKSIDKIWRLLKKTFNIAVSRRKIIFNPMDDETLNKPISNKENKQTEALSKEEEEKLLVELEKIKDTKPLIYLAVLLQLNTGMRIGEVLALSTDCINLEKNTITVYRTLTRIGGDYILGKHTKTYDRKTGVDKGKRTFFMTPKAAQIVSQLLNQKVKNINKLLFWDCETNRLLTPRKINDFLRIFNKHYNITEYLRSHKLRHTFITRCQEKGIPLVVIQAMVGHIKGSSVTNDTYTSVSLEFMKEEIAKIS